MFILDKQSGKPMYEQVIEGFKHLVLTDALRSNEQIPSVRSLAIELSINPNTIQKAYTVLEQEGITYSSPGIGRFIHQDAKKILRKEMSEQSSEFKRMLRDLALANVSKQEILEMVDSVFITTNKGGSDD